MSRSHARNAHYSAIYAERARAAPPTTPEVDDLGGGCMCAPAGGDGLACPDADGIPLCCKEGAPA